jgi:hypothetical protein
MLRNPGFALKGVLALGSRVPVPARRSSACCWARRQTGRQARMTAEPRTMVLKASRESTSPAASSRPASLRIARVARGRRVDELRVEPRRFRIQRKRQESFAMASFEPIRATREARLCVTKGARGAFSIA